MCGNRKRQRKRGPLRLSIDVAQDDAVGRALRITHRGPAANCIKVLGGLLQFIYRPATGICYRGAIHQLFQSIQCNKWRMQQV